MNFFILSTHIKEGTVFWFNMAHILGVLQCSFVFFFLLCCYRQGSDANILSIIFLLISQY